MPESNPESSSLAPSFGSDPEPVETHVSEPGSAAGPGSFRDILSQFERSQPRSAEGDPNRQIDAILVALSPESAFFDIGFKTEGILPLSAFGEKPPTIGDRVKVSVKNRNEEGYYELSLLKIAQPKDWTLLEQAFQAKEAVLGTVTALIKGGVIVDIGVRAFMPASRSGTRDAASLAKLVGEQLRVRIIKLDIADENIVVDRRVLAEEEDRIQKDRRYSEVQEGDVVSGTVRSLAEYGAFVDLGGVDGLLHVSDIAWSRVSNPADALAVGQQIEVKVLKIDPEKQRISLGLKQLQPQPWDAVPGKYHLGDQVQGTVTRLTDFGAFIELQPGVEGLIHLSEMSWAKKVRKPEDIFKPGETVEAIILGIKLEERRISLGFKQLLGDPWADAVRRFPAGSVVEGPVTSFTKFGAFVEVAENVEGMIHISEITAERRLNHPQEALKVGEIVKALVLEIDKEKRQLKLSIKQMTPVSVDEYFAEHHPGDTVSGRVMDVRGDLAQVELGEGILATCALPDPPARTAESISGDSKVDLTSLTSLLQARWKGKAAAVKAAPEPVRTGQVRSFRIIHLDAASKSIQLSLA